MIGTTTSLEVSTLGRFEIRRHSLPLSGGNWNRKKVCDLFKLLLTAEQHRLHREQIQDILWPTAAGEQAANSFGKTLYLLRRALEPELTTSKGSASLYVLLDHDTLTLVPHRFAIDADTFEALGRELQAKTRSRASKEQHDDSAAILDEFDRVLSLYKGDYLPEDLYEDWSQRRRDRLRRSYSWLLENAANLALALAQGQQAAEYLQTLLEQNSADEQTHRQLMLLYARMGRRSDALNQYLLLREVLKAELRTHPLPETTELYRSIQAGRVTVDLASATSPLKEPAARIARITTPEPRSSQSPGDFEQELPDQGQIDPNRILNADLVGRESELTSFQRAYNQAREGQRRVIFINGEPGIGKTRLAREFTRWGEITQHAVVLWGYCYEMSGSLPYQPVADALNAHITACSSQQLRSLLGNYAVDLAKIVPAVRLILPDLPQPEPVGPELERRNLYNAVAHYFNTLAAQHPLIIILDDLQWADAATMQLLSFLMMQSTGATPQQSSLSPTNRPLPLYILLYRAGEVYETHPLRELLSTFTRHGMSDEIRVQRLSEQQVHQLLVNIVGHAVGPVFAAEIFRQTEGNPFFIGEAVRSLILEGKVKWTGERWQSMVAANELEIPQSVRLLIERRLLRLPPACRSTLALAAVLGRQFNSSLLCQACNTSEDEIAAHIDDAISAQILSALYDAAAATVQHAQAQDSASHGHDQARDADLAFTHDKIREVLYQWLNPLRRRALHRQVAQAIEARYQSRLQPFYSALAYHYQMAENTAQAVDYLLKAAAHASSVYAFVDCSVFMKNAIDLLIGDEDRPRRAALLRQLADVYIYTGRPDKAIEADMASAALWSDLGNAVQQAETYLHVAFSSHWQGREIDAVEHIKQALQCIEFAPEELYLHAKAYAQWGMAATIMGEPVQADQLLSQAEQLHAQVGGNDPFVLVVSTWARSWLAYLSASPQQMLTYALDGAEICRTTHNPAWEPMMTYSAAWASMLLGQLETGHRLAQYALAGAQQHGVVGAQGWAHLAQAFLAIQAGQWDTAILHADQASHIANMLHDSDLQARILWSRSVCDGWRDEWRQAIAHIEEALVVAQQDGETSMVYPYLLVQAAKSHYYLGNIPEAQRYLDRAIELGRQRHYRQLLPIGQRLQGRIWQTEQNFEAAQTCFELALAAFQSLDDIVEYARTQEAYSYFYLARAKPGDEAKGKELLRLAKTTFSKLGMRG